MEVAGIILAAGRGSRMKNLTADKPKCMLELAGRPLLDWQLDAFKFAEIEKILVVRGYAAECLTGPFETTENSNWQNSNMLSSLLCANDFVQKAFAEGYKKIVVSYSDIVYNGEHVKKLLSNDEHIAITYDTLWQNLWNMRFSAKLLADAETFRQENGLLQEIGNRPNSIDEIQGQYMGLLAFDQQGWQILLDACHKLGDAVSKTDMTSFLRFLLNANVAIGAVPVAGKWCEADSESDLRKYNEAIADATWSHNCWSHDWR